MNKIYKNIWNHVTRTFTAVSEIKTKKGKVGKSVLAATVASVILVSGGSPVHAGVYIDGKVIDINGIYIGNNSQSSIKHEEWTSISNGIGDGIELNFSPANSLYDNIGGMQGLISQGVSGYRQLVLKSDVLIDTGDAQGMFNTSNLHTLTQNLIQGDATVAKLHYAAGGRAYDLFINNQNTIGASFEVKDGQIYFEGEDWGYTDDGMAWAREHAVTDDNKKGIFLLTFLTGIELNQGQTLVLDGLDNTEDPNHRNVLSPIISGGGSLTLKGSGSVDIESVITLDESGNAYDSANTYTGETAIESSDENTFVVNLNKKDSFGQTSKLTATNAQINVKTTDAWTSVQRIDSTKSTINFASSQTFFSITGLDAAGASAAQFTGVNVINAAADAFTLNVSNGSLEVGREAGKDEGDNTIFTTGSLTIQNFDANSQSLVLSIANNLNINGDSLLNLSASADSGTINVAQNVTFNSVSDLLQYGIKASQLTAQEQVKLIESNGEYSLNTAAKTFYVESGAVQIVAGTTIDVDETDVVSGASLKASIDQLGKNILISGKDEEGLKSTIRVTNDGNLNFDKDVLAASDGVLHFNLYSDSELAEENRGVLFFEENSGKSGNSVLVRLSNATYTYESNDGFSSYVVGGNGEFIYAGNSTINLNTIGWQYTDENAQKTGVVNLVGYDFDVHANDPAIIAGEIYFSESHNELWIDQDDFTGVTGSTDRTNILALDRANQSRLLIAGQKSEDSPEEPTIILKDENGQDIESQESTYLDSSHGGNRAAGMRVRKMDLIDRPC